MSVTGEAPTGAAAPQTARRAPPGYGEFAPDFTALSDSNPRFRFNTVAGRWIVLLFFGSAGLAAARQALDAVGRRRRLFDDVDAAFFGVSVDPQDRSDRGLRNALPGLRYFWDFDRAVSVLYGAAVSGEAQYRPMALLLDRFQRVVTAGPLEEMDALLDDLAEKVAGDPWRRSDQTAPVLTVPHIFEPSLCEALIAYYEAHGGEPSGFMQEVEGLTVGRHDPGNKRRKDVAIEDASLREATRARLHQRLAPAVARAFAWRATRIERYIVACYEGADRGFFFPHRDNTSAGTAHRKFAVSLNLNADYDGGELRFPEFGARSYKPPPGGATVFSCSLLHEATPVTRGVRYAFLPFLYDDEGAQVRAANAHLVKTGD